MHLNNNSKQPFNGLLFWFAPTPTNSNFYNPVWTGKDSQPVTATNHQFSKVNGKKKSSKNERTNSN